MTDGPAARPRSAARASPPKASPAAGGAPTVDVVPGGPYRVAERMEANFQYSYGQVSPFFRALKEEGELRGARCPSCGRVYCPPRGSCPLCHRPVEWVPLSGEGTIYSLTVVHYPSSDWKGEVPYAAAYIQLDGCANAILHWVRSDDPRTLRIGDRVKAVFRPEREGKVSDLYFVPIERKARTSSG